MSKWWGREWGWTKRLRMDVNKWGWTWGWIKGWKWRKRMILSMSKWWGKEWGWIKKWEWREGMRMGVRIRMNKEVKNDMREWGEDYE